MSPKIVGQICSTASYAHNLQQCITLIQKAAAAKATALFLPEASDYIASSASESISLCLPANKSPFLIGLREEARKHRLPISVGVHEPSSTPASPKIGKGKFKVKNTLLWIDEGGEIKHRYQKLHLFDVDLDEHVIRESDSVEPGSSILPPFSTSIGQVGYLICFDLRFPEPALSLRRQGAQIITYPSAFTVPTGKAHWETLLRARAIETQTYVIAAAQCGRHNEKRVSYGRGMVIDPWGRVVCELSGVENESGEELDGRDLELGFAEIDLNVSEKAKRDIKLVRRLDVYPEV